ncbi:Response regulator receiver domain-containing protein [Saccharicrinis carchari]|uniref:Response regulator receiver domain-containing protein n=1 Tax=Saccharicrinis carchari TaxID=1168039 RepID=A0A521C8V0_SACCC|nr:response regulator [Saccharicrinis carchari]SMO55140.1 Response regulator receiver domain-containing protein [Saccharicrinis carchari]
MKAEESYKVIIADDSHLFIEGMQLLFEELPQYEIVSIAHNGNAILNHPDLAFIDLLLLDVNMPLLDGISAGRQINFKYPDLKMVAITLNSDQVYLEQLIRSGFKAFIDKAKITTHLSTVLNKVMDNNFVFPQEILSNLIPE